MKLLCAKFALLLCVGWALAQDCTRTVSYSATTFDTINFVPSRTFYDINGGYLYVKNIGDEGAQFFDFNVGAVYVKAANGTCVKYESDDYKLKSLSDEELIQATQVTVRFTDIRGVTGVDKELTNNNLVLNFLKSAQCYNYFASWSFNNEVMFARLYINSQALSDTDVQTINSARLAFEAYGCTSQALQG